MKDLKHLLYFERLLEEANNELIRQAQDVGTGDESGVGGGDEQVAVGGGMLPVPEEQVDFRVFGQQALPRAAHGGEERAVVGGLVLGIAESMTTGYLSGNYEDVLSFCLLILILIFRPDGILGKKQVQKV